MKINVDDIPNVVKEQGYKYIRLLNSEGGTLVGANNKTVSISQRIEEIQNNLNGGFLAEGVYVLECKKGQGRNISPQQYTIIKGNPQPATLPAPVVAAKKNTLTDREAIEAYYENGVLKVQIENLKAEIKSLQEEIEEMESDAKELSESPEAKISKLAEAAVAYAPIIAGGVELLKGLLNNATNQKTAGPASGVQNPGGTDNGNGSDIPGQRQYGSEPVAQNGFYNSPGIIDQ